MCLSPSCYHGMHAFRGCWRRMMERARVSDCVEWSHLPTCPDCFETVLGEGDQLTSLNPWCRYEGISLLQQLGLYPILTIAWRRQWHPTPALLPGKSHGGRAWWLQSMGSLRVGHDWATSLSLFTFMRWRRKWQPTPVFLPGESQGRRSLVGCRLWGRTESDTAEAT